MPLKTVIIALAVTACLCAAAAPAAAQDTNLCLEEQALSDNLIENGSFEKPFGDFAAGWHRTAESCLLGEDSSPDGRRHLVLAIPRGRLNASVTAEHRVTVGGGECLRLDFKARTMSDLAENTRVVIGFTDRDGHVLSQAVEAVGRSETWQGYSRMAVVPFGAVGAEVAIEIALVEGPLLVDDLRLVRVRRPRAWSELDSTQDPAQGAIDGIDELTRPHYWAGGKVPNVLTVSLLGSRHIHRIVWRHDSRAPEGQRTERGPEDYSLWISEDGEVWFRLLEAKGFLGGWREHVFPPVPAQFVRLRIDRTQMMSSPLLTEFEVWGRRAAGGAAPQPQPTEREAEGRGAPPGGTEAAHGEDPQPSATLRVSRLRLAPDETLNVVMDTAHLRPADCPAAATLWLRAGVEPPGNLREWFIPRTLGEGLRIEYTPNVLLRNGGYHLRFELRTARGATVAADDVFLVADDPRVGCRIAGYDAQLGLQPGFPEERIRREVEKGREIYADTLLLGPRWVAMGMALPRTSPYITSPRQFQNSQRAARLWCELAQEAGLRCIAHHLFGHAAPEDRPEWWVYGPLAYPSEWPVRLAHGERVDGEDLARRFPAGEPAGLRQPEWPNNGIFQNTLAMQDHYVEQFSGDMLQAGWDGYFLDDAAEAFDPTAYGHDRRGERITGLSHDDVGDQVLGTIRSGVNGRLGRPCLLVADMGNLNGMAPGYPESVMAVLSHRGRTSYPRTARHAVWFLECPDHTESPPLPGTRQPWTYEELFRGLRGLRELNETALVVNLRAFSRRELQTVPNIAPAYAILCAAGATHEMVFTEREVVENVIKPYNKFCVRYADYLFPSGIRWAADVDVEAAPAGHLYWRDALLAKSLTTGERELYIHLINLPADHGIYDLLHEAPPIARNVRLSLTLPAGYVARDAWCLSPDGPQDPVPAPVEANVLTVPEVRTWTLTVVKLRSNGA